MGTSVTQRSPATLAWNAVRLGYRFAQVPEPRVLRDVWRAAQTDEAGNWATLLASPVVADGMRIVSDATDPRAAVMEFSRLVAASGASSLAADVVKRAVVGAFASDDRSREFAARVFSSATDYLVSRDLSGSVGLGTRNRTVVEAIGFKDRMTREAAARAREVAGANPSPQEWSETVPRIVRALAER